MADGVVNLTIDGVPVSVPPGTLLIEAAKQAGGLVPHYFYHPGLPVARLCRMGPVGVDEAPEVQSPGPTPAARGMVPRSPAEQAQTARRGGARLPVINH